MPMQELEEELRRGRLPDTVLVQHPDWTGLAFAPANAVPALQEALSSAEAQMCRRLRGWKRTPGIALLCVAMALAGVTQLIFGVTEGAAVGFVPTILDGAWWSPLSAHFTHVHLGHFVTNVPILAYSGYRVERFFGAWGLAAVAIASMLVSTALILLFSDLPVVGASTLVHGVWMAVIVIGVRHSHLIPPELQSRYGIANLALYLPLAALSLFGGPYISHLGHAGGALGGLVAAALLPVPVGASSSGTATARWASAAALLGLLLLPHVPPVVWAGVGGRTEISRMATAELPGRYALPMRFCGMRAWGVGDGHPLFGGTFVIEAGTATPAVREAELWGDWLGGKPEVTELAEGRFEIVVRGGEGDFRLVEHVVDHGDFRTRIGYLLPLDCGACDMRRQVGEAFANSLVTQ